jgi:hypothetical protein
MRKHFLLIGDDADPAFIQLIGGMTVAGQELRALTDDELDRLQMVRHMKRGESITRVVPKGHRKTPHVGGRSAWETFRFLVGKRRKFALGPLQKKFLKEIDPKTGRSFKKSTFTAVMSHLKSAGIAVHDGKRMAVKDPFRFDEIGTTELNAINSPRRKRAA